MIEFTSKITADLVDTMGIDKTVCDAARVSTGAQYDAERDPGLINSLMRERHGVPFEHILMSWEIHAPIFVAREAVRHRVSSWSEMSGRYRELEPIFYAPAADRPLVQSGKPMAYHLDEGTTEQLNMVHHAVRHAATVAWSEYQHMLDTGIAKEVARIVLPGNIYTRWRWSMNGRALMNFLSLRVRDEEAAIISKPQLEIQALASEMERDFAYQFPLIHAAFVANRRVAP